MRTGEVPAGGAQHRRCNQPGASIPIVTGEPNALSLPAHGLARGSTRSVAGDQFLTTMVSVRLPLFPARSYAMTATEYEPFGTVRVSQY